MCRLFVDGTPGSNGQESRHARANFLSKLSRMHTARATVSMGKSARLKIACTAGTEAVVSEADDGIRLTKWMAGPVGDVCGQRLTSDCL